MKLDGLEILRTSLWNMKGVWRKEVIETALNLLNEQEAKAKAWDKLSMSIRECNKEIELKDGLNAMFRTSKKGQIVQRHIDCFESGESNELRE